jgi:hypothetical protein
MSSAAAHATSRSWPLQVSLELQVRPPYPIPPSGPLHPPMPPLADAEEAASVVDCISWQVLSCWKAASQTVVRPQPANADAFWATQLSHAPNGDAHEPWLAFWHAPSQFAASPAQALVTAQTIAHEAPGVPPPTPVGQSAQHGPGLPGSQHKIGPVDTHEPPTPLGVELLEVPWLPPMPAAVLACSTTVPPHAAQSTAMTPHAPIGSTRIAFIEAAGKHDQGQAWARSNRALSGSEHDRGARLRPSMCHTEPRQALGRRPRRALARSESASRATSAPPGGVGATPQPQPPELACGAGVPPSAMEPPSGVQTPDEHVPPGHTAPSGFWGFEHWPLAGSQAPNSWHASVGRHWVGSEVQAPPWQVAELHASLWEQDWPVLMGVTVQVPVLAWQCSASLHGPAAGHDATVQQTPSVQYPLRQSPADAQAPPFAAPVTYT